MYSPRFLSWEYLPLCSFFFSVVDTYWCCICLQQLPAGASQNQACLLIWKDRFETWFNSLESRYRLHRRRPRGSTIQLVLHYYYFYFLAIFFFWRAPIEIYYFDKASTVKYDAKNYYYPASYPVCASERGTSIWSWYRKSSRRRLPCIDGKQSSKGLFQDP